MFRTTTKRGLHDFVGDRVLTRYVQPGVRAADLGAGPGAMAARLRSLGCDVVAVDRDSKGFEAGVPHISLDFDQDDFASQIGAASFDLVRAIEVIEHVENPIDSLRKATYEDFALNAYLWLLLGILFRLPTLAASAQLAVASSPASTYYAARNL